MWVGMGALKHHDFAHKYGTLIYGEICHFLAIAGMLEVFF
jgi:hypothetical protein